jgi:hypothetical protein
VRAGVARRGSVSGGRDDFEYIDVDDSNTSSSSAYCTGVNAGDNHCSCDICASDSACVGVTERDCKRWGQAVIADRHDDDEHIDIVDSSTSRCVERG